MNFAAIITLFHPEQSPLLNNIDLLCQAGWTVVIVDNSPDSHQHWFSANIHYLQFADNAGIAAAQNSGLKLAQQLQSDFAMLLDQDSELNESFIAALMMRTQKACRQFNQLAAYGPTIVSQFDHRAVKAGFQKPIKSDDGFLICRQIIASGMTIPLSVINDIGLMEEGLFIDGVDHEWCWRAQQKGYVVVCDSETSLLHRQGEERKRLLGITFKIGQPLRLYYQYRNILVLLRRAYVPLYWKARNLIALPVRWLVNRFFVADSTLRGRYISAGIKDGLRARTGRYKTDK
ncbi:glycosyltransferase family 2 protein [Alteromonas gilva]|uniref:Glycosyltransferase family 2 protein n=1 Tax=Alteromonas gilva TaxID=2987522 RepID=A0ABT5L6M7_9ALTE|nr:glycosyltransferase family 2 protein [Alteromonas gilva]MDC8832681.1 glycosyltransferase family 2 protein [Alteromonas gilva]